MTDYTPHEMGRKLTLEYELARADDEGMYQREHILEPTSTDSAHYELERAAWEGMYERGLQ